jgi:hypothetical protein
VAGCSHYSLITTANSVLQKYELQVTLGEAGVHLVDTGDKVVPKLVSKVAQYDRLVTRLEGKWWHRTVIYTRTFWCQVLKVQDRSPLCRMEMKDVKLVLDVSTPTDRQVDNIRPDLQVYLHERSKRLAILEVACAGEPLVLEREERQVQGVCLRSCDASGGMAGNRPHSGSWRFGQLGNERVIASSRHSINWYRLCGGNSARVNERCSFTTQDIAAGLR